MSSESTVADHRRYATRLAKRDALSTRCFDLFGAGIGLLLLWPLLLAIALVVKLTSPGPAFFRSTRIGHRGRPFTLYKFRSMIDESEATGPAITAAGDPRVTPIGKTLRRLKLDELPQLLNVLRGEMSLVGPRPENPCYVALYSREQLQILDVKPGMTSPASLMFRNEEELLTGEDWENRYLHEVMPLKLAIDCEYARRRSILSDLRVIFATFAALWRRGDDGA